jgi:hypothetical protein
MGIASVDIVPIFPSKHLREFTADWLELSASNWRKMLQGMKSLLHLRLSRLDIEPVLEALDVRDGVYRKATRIMLNHSYADS